MFVIDGLLEKRSFFMETKLLLVSVSQIDQKEAEKEDKKKRKRYFKFPPFN
jgi:hypothetical protein